jgi:hypothetical protein
MEKMKLQTRFSQNCDFAFTNLLTIRQMCVMNIIKKSILVATEIQKKQFYFRFGVCCLFLVTSTSATISQNCTYLQNPSFPSAYSGTGALSYTISKCSAGKQ